MWLLMVAKYTAAALLLLALAVNAQYTSYNPAGSATTVRTVHILFTTPGTWHWEPQDCVSGLHIVAARRGASSQSQIPALSPPAAHKSDVLRWTAGTSVPAENMHNIRHISDGSMRACIPGWQGCTDNWAASITV